MLSAAVAASNGAGVAKRKKKKRNENQGWLLTRGQLRGILTQPDSTFREKLENIPSKAYLF